MRILSYDLDLDVDFERALLSGRVVVKVKGAAGRFKLDAVNLDVKAVKVNGRPVTFKASRRSGTLDVGPVPRAASSVEVEYSKQVSDDAIFGIYKSKYGNEYFLVTDLEPSEARRVFPCKDEPSFKATFNVRVTTDPGLTVIGNTPVASTEKGKGGRVTFTFEPTPRMSTYLFLLAIGRFEETSKRSGSTTAVVASRPGQRERARFILDLGAAALRYYSDYYGIKYPLRKLHMIALPEYHTGAMENWGAITSREPYVLVGSDASEASRRQAALVMAHEIAHQWFGDLVTMAWWDDLWLNESFATFVEHKMVEWMHPEWGVWRTFMRMDVFRSMNADALSTTHPIEAKVKTEKELAQIFDAISYGKGASVLAMIESYVGEAAFRRGVSAYLKKFSYSNARGSDLWSSIAKASRLPVSEVMSEWVHRAGHPVVSAEKDGQGVRLTQRRFQLTGRPGDETWPIPLTMRVDGKTRSQLMTERSVTLEARRLDGFLVNPGRTGYYHVLYDEELYEALAKGFRSLGPYDRAGLLNDLYLFLQAGMVDPALYFRFVSLSGPARDPLLVETVVDQLGYLNSLVGDVQEARKLFMGFYGPQARRLGLRAAKGEDESTGVVRESLLTQLVQVDKGYARKLASEFSRYDRLDPNSKWPVVTAYALEGGRRAFDELLSRVKAEEDEHERIRMYYAMAASPDPRLVEKTLELGISGDVSRSDSGYTLGGASANPYARGAVWRWIKKRYERMKELYGGSQQFMLYMDRAIPRCGVGNEEDVRRFLSGKRLAEGELTYRRTLEMLEVNSRVRRRLVAHV